MARKPRVYTDSGIYHAILRGNDQQNLFLDESDRIFFINRLNKYAIELKIELYAYCLMSNHVHILLGNATESLSKFVQKLANSYVYYFNRKYERSGHLFQGRFKSEPINDDEYFKTAFRYILQNPEKSGIAKTDSYKWNSYFLIFKEDAVTQMTNLDTERSKFRRSHKVSHSGVNSLFTTQSIEVLPPPVRINREYIFRLFGGVENTKKFISVKNSDNCMEYRNRPVINDSKGLFLIKKICGIHTPFKLIKFPPAEQSEKLKQLKCCGLSVNQIARLTGIPRYIINKS